VPVLPMGSTCQPARPVPVSGAACSSARRPSVVRVTRRADAGPPGWRLMSAASRASGA
jgi:hypothetical protein